jgi:hypothetical protein
VSGAELGIRESEFGGGVVTKSWPAPAFPGQPGLAKALAAYCPTFTTYDDV